MHTDPIADMLTRIRNACQGSKAMVEMPHSKLKEEIAKLLLKEGYIRSYERQVNQLRILLKYDDEGYSVIRSIQRVSRPGLRRYSRSTKLPRVISGAGIAIVSTSKGLLTDRAARRDGVGGEVLCTVH